MTNPNVVESEDSEFDLDNLDSALAGLADVAVEGGFDGENDDACAGGACKI